MDSIILATSNFNKKKEYEEMLQNQFILYTGKEKGILIDVEENGTTFEQNAILKAKAYVPFTEEIILSDDSGLIIDALPDILNVHTARFMEGSNYQKRCEEVLKRMQNVTNRSARFVCVICLITKDKNIHLFKGICEGTISYSLKGTNGFGYNPIFIPKGYSLTFAEMDDDLKNKISHRGIATQKLQEFIMLGGLK